MSKKAPAAASKNPPRVAIGWREWVGFPELGFAAIKAKVDTGARSSSLHAVDIETFRKRGVEWVRFEVHPEQRSVAGSRICEAVVFDRRSVRSSNGKKELRVFIHTLAKLGGETWPIELTLTGRSDMGFRLLLGREAMRRRFIVDPGRSFLQGERDARPGMLDPRRGTHHHSARTKRAVKGKTT